MVDAVRRPELVALLELRLQRRDQLSQFGAAATVFCCGPSPRQSSNAVDQEIISDSRRQREAQTRRGTTRTKAQKTRGGG